MEHKEAQAIRSRIFQQVWEIGRSIPDPDYEAFLDCFRGGEFHVKLVLAKGGDVSLRVTQPQS